MLDQMGLNTRQPVFKGLRTTKVQTSLRNHALISAIITLFLDSISKLATSEILIFYLVSVAEETGYSLALSET